MTIINFLIIVGRMVIPNLYEKWESKTAHKSELREEHILTTSCREIIINIRVNNA